ncbi:hypothetical protein WME97_27765 [Sorangium sp. So ce367]|uniref:hypothetical protein n=1 Tax=Sorangium sp. So ce367 TaxID=3133305 RepID=UPI003F6147B0
MQITLARARLQVALFALLAAVASAGLAVEVLKPILNLKSRSGVVPLLSLSYEQNVPTWYTSCLLFTCALTLAAIATGARREGRFVKHWWGLAAAFLYISFDEVVQIHEAASSWFDLGGVLYFSWVIPAAVVVAAFAVAYLRFLAHLPRGTRNRFLLSGGIYVTGALVLELPLGYWTEQAGSNNVVYGLIDFVEESMEMLGVNLFLLSLVDYLGVQGWTIGFSLAAPEPRPAADERAA